MFWKCGCAKFCTFPCLQVQKSVCDVPAVVFPILSVLRLNKNLYRHQNGTKSKSCKLLPLSPKFGTLGTPRLPKVLFNNPGHLIRSIATQNEWKRSCFHQKLTFIYPIISKISNVYCMMSLIIKRWSKAICTKINRLIRGPLE